MFRDAQAEHRRQEVRFLPLRDFRVARILIVSARAAAVGAGSLAARRDGTARSAADAELAGKASGHRDGFRSARQSC